MDRNLSKEQIRWYKLENKVFERKIELFFKLFREARIEPILIKGWAAARFYPENQPRPYSDIDLAIAPEMFGKALEILGNRLEVDLHEGFRKLDLLSWNDLYERSELVEIGENYKIRVPSHEDHLRILCIHWLLDGGAFRDKLWDVFYLCENRPKDFDWNYFLNSNGQVRRFWLESVLLFVQMRFGLDLRNAPIQAEKPPEWFVKAVEKEWSSSTVGLTDLRNSSVNFRTFGQQLKKRFIINPVQAFVMEEGDFRKDTILRMRLRNFANRLKHSLKKTFD